MHVVRVLGPSQSSRPPWRKKRTTHLTVLHIAVPGLDRVRRAQEAPELMHKHARIVAAQKVPQQLHGMPIATLQIDSLQHGDDVLEDELGVVLLASRTRGVVVVVYAAVEKLKDVQLAADPAARAREQARVGVEAGGGDFAVARRRVGSNMQGKEAVAVDVASALEGALQGSRRRRSSSSSSSSDGAAWQSCEATTAEAGGATGNTVCGGGGDPIGLVLVVLNF